MQWKEGLGLECRATASSLSVTFCLLFLVSMNGTIRGMNNC